VDKLKKFIALLDENESGFYISTQDFWDENNCIDDEGYDTEILKPIENLGCGYDRENHFTIYSPAPQKLADVKKFLAPLPWINVIGDTTLVK
jgi:hypothetical protein